MIDTNLNIDKRFFWKYINRKIGRKVKSYHVMSIINILFEEITADLKGGKGLKIFNFGEILLKNSKPRKYHDVRYNRIMLSSGNKILKLVLPRVVRKKLCQSLDIDKTFEGDYE